MIQGLPTDPELLKCASMGGAGHNMRAVYTAQALCQREFGIFQLDLSPPSDERDMDLIVAAVEKLVNHIHELKEGTP